MQTDDSIFLQKTMADIFNVSLDDIGEDARIKETPGWDSFTHVQLMIALEKYINQRISPKETVRLIGFVEILDYILAKRSTQQAVEAPAEKSGETLSQQIREGLKGVGISAGDVLIVHSRLNAANDDPQHQQIVIEEILNVLGPEGTLILPAFSSQFIDTGAFDRKNTASDMGVLSEFIKTYEGVAVSQHPFHRFFAIGNHAKAITAEQSQTSFGEDSPLARMNALEGKILFLSVEWDVCTFFHYIEENIGVPYRHIKEFSGEISSGPDTVVETWSMYVRNDTADVSNDFAEFGKQVDKAGLSKEHETSSYFFRCVDMTDLYTFTQKAIELDPYCLTTKTPPLVD